MSLEQVWQNFRYRLEQLSAPADIYGVADKFEFWDHLQHSPDNPARSRLFTVDWLGAEKENQVGKSDIVCNLSLRITDHRFRVRVYYNSKLRHEALQRLVLKDRKAVIAELRNPAQYNGISTASPSTDTGLEHRWKETDETTETDTSLVWESVWVCTAQETD